MINVKIIMKILKIISFYLNLSLNLLKYIFFYYYKNFMFYRFFLNLDKNDRMFIFILLTYHSVTTPDENYI